MKRRDFLKSAGIASITPNLVISSLSHASDSEFPLSIMKGDLTPSEGSLQVISGELPDDIQGHVFMAEGISLERNHLSPNGRGALTRLDFSSEGVNFTRKMIDTPSVIMQDNVTGLLDKFDLKGGTIYSSTNLGYMNYCNTAPNYMGDNRFALSYEGGMPFEFDATTLELVTSIGNQDEWKSSLPPFVDFFSPKKWLFPQVRTTGHPFFDLEQSQCFTINYGGNIGNSGLKDGFIRLIQWDMKGAFKTWNIVSREGSNAYIAATSHSMGVTRNHILIFETAAYVESSRILGFRTVEPQKHRTPVWIIRKADLVEGQTNVVADYVVLDFDTSDIMCNYDDWGDEITLFGQYLGAMDKSEQQFNWERLYFGDRVDCEISGYPVAPVDVGGLVRARIKVNAHSANEIKSDFRALRDASTMWDLNDPAYRGHFQFPESFDHVYWAAIGYRPEHLVRRVAKAYKDYPNRIYSNETLPKTSLPSALIHMDCRNIAIADQYQFPSDCVMRTPQFMNRPGSTAQDHGYIFTAVVRKYPSGPQSNGKEFWIFDAKNISQGPLCILANPNLEFATTNHALWVESIAPRPYGAYKSNMADFFREKMPSHSRNVRQILEDKVLPVFG